jgi:hypothetical protein
MANALQEQLIKMGLATEEQVRPAKKPARPDSAGGGKRGGGKRGGRRGGRSAEARRSLPVEARPDPYVEKARQKALRAEVRALIDEHRQNADDAEIPHHFVKSGRIKRVFLTEVQRQAFARGELVVVAVEGSHHLLGPEAAEKILAVAPRTFVHRHDDSPPAEDEGEHPVPDDLIW